MANGNGVDKTANNSITPGNGAMVDSDREIRRYTMSQQVRRLEATLISDAEIGAKPAVVGLFDSVHGVGAWRDSAHQGHLVEFSIEHFEHEGEAAPRARLTVHVVEEIHPARTLQSRTLKFGELVHLLLNITDDEMAAIIARVDPAQEQPGSKGPSKDGSDDH